MILFRSSFFIEQSSLGKKDSKLKIKVLISQMNYL